jgi:DNA-directed RNA polymerase specialized sigma24 family protein
MTNDEVAQITDKSVGAVKSLQHRALAALRRHLISQEEEKAT